MGSSISLRGGRIAGSYPVQRLVIEPCLSVWNVFWILGRVLESGHCFWTLGNVLSVRATILSSSLFFPAFVVVVVVVSLALFSLSKCLPGIEQLMHHFRPLYVDSIS